MSAREVQEILNAAFDESTGQLRVSTVGAIGALTPHAPMAIQEIWNRVFDSATNSIRTVS